MIAGVPGASYISNTPVVKMADRGQMIVMAKFYPAPGVIVAGSGARVVPPGRAGAKAGRNRSESGLSGRCVLRVVRVEQARLRNHCNANNPLARKRP
jgi:hypothetical protein